MKILAGFFYLLVFAGILAVAHQTPVVRPEPVVVEQETKPTPAELLAGFNSFVAKSDWDAAKVELAGLSASGAISPESHAIFAASLSMATEGATEATQQSKKTHELLTEMGDKLSATRLSNAAELTKLKDSIDTFGESVTEATVQFDRFNSRIEELEARPVPPVIEPGNTTGEETPEEGTPASEEEKVEPAEKMIKEPEADPTPPAPEPVPTPRTVSIPFAVGSMNFSQGASDDLEKVADKLKEHDQFVVNLNGSTTGFAAGLANGRASAVKAKLAEFGIDGSRIKVSEVNGKGSDSVSVSFKKKPVPTPES